MDDIAQALDELERDGLRRRTTVWAGTGGHVEASDGRRMLNFSSNDYLNLAQNPHARQRAIEAIERWGCGATASRLMCGTLDIHEELEQALARLVGGESALVFSSGFGMNVGLIAALAGRDDVIFTDRLNHASLVDGARLSGATVKRFAHNQLEALELALVATPCRGRRLIVCESVYSMDGDIAPLAAMRTLADRHGAMLVVDEAHAIGVFGNGGGVARQFGIRPDLTIGTLGKALGSLGGFVVCTSQLREFLINRARSFIYATALAPACAGAVLGALDVLEQDPGLGTRLLKQAQEFHRQMALHAASVAEFESQIIPVRVGGNEAAVKLAAKLREAGLLVTAIRPPTVPAGTARLRLSVTLAHTADELTGAAEALGRAVREAGAMS